MNFGKDRAGIVASDYRRRFGARAIARLDDDISRAIGSVDWEECRLLQRARLRLRRIELHEQIAERMALCRVERRPFASAMLPSALS